MSPTRRDESAGISGVRKARGPRRGALSGAALGLVGAAAVAAAAAAVVWPLWYLATEHTGLYTQAASVALVAGVAWSIAARLRRRRGAAPVRPARE